MADIEHKIQNWQVVRQLSETKFEIRNVFMPGHRAVLHVGPTLPHRPGYLNAAAALAIIRDPSVEQLFDVGFLEDGSPYVVTEYLEGQTLEELLRLRGPLSAPEAAHLGGAISGALESIHRTGVVHRAISPTSIFVTSNGTFKVTDFDLALSRTIEEPPELLVGYPFYMAPEQFMGGTVTPAADIYGLGVTLFQALTGELPFRADSLPELFGSVLRDQPPRPQSLRADIPTSLEDLVLAMLSKEPDQRPNVGAIREHVLRSLTEGDGVEARGPSSGAALPTVAIDHFDSLDDSELVGNLVERTEVHLNVWFQDWSEGEPPFAVDVSVTVCINLGPPSDDTWGLVPRDATARLYATDYVDVALHCGGADVEPPRQRLPMPPDPERIVDFVLTPRMAGSLQLAVMLLIRGEIMHHAIRSIEVEPARIPTLQGPASTRRLVEGEGA